MSILVHVEDCDVPHLYNFILKSCIPWNIVNTFFQIEFSSLAVGWSWWCRVGVNRVYLWWWECCRLLKYSFWWELSFFMWDSLTTDDSATPKVILLGNLQHRYLDIEVEKCMNNDIIIILPNLCWASLELGAGVVHWQTEIWRWWWIFVCRLLSACQYKQQAEYLRLAHHWECSPAPYPPPTRLVASSRHFLPLCNKDVCPTESSFPTFIGQ